MTRTLRPKVLVVGGGPGGYVAAIRAGQLGLDTLLVEGERLGGTCLVRGCIPSKALIHAASKFDEAARSVGGSALGIRLEMPPVLDLAATIGWKDGIVRRLQGGVASLLRKAKVQTLVGKAFFHDAKTCTVTTDGEELKVVAEYVILANGSLPVALPSLPFGGPTISSTEALSLTTLPERLVVVGGGYIGIELGTAFRKLGSSVTIVEVMDRILPLFDTMLVKPVEERLQKMGVTLWAGARAKNLETKGNGHSLIVETRDGDFELQADTILVTVGRKPNTQGWGLENMAVDLANGCVEIDDQCRTSMRGVFAIGDLTGEPMLAHRASAQGEMVAEIIAGHQRRFEPACIPAVCFTDPEIVSVGLTEAEGRAAGIEVKSSVFPFAANGRAMTLEDDGGFVRVITRKDNNRVVGVQAVGAHVSELSGEFAHAIEMRAVAEDLAATVHAHPTLGEAFREAALMATGAAIHF